MYYALYSFTCAWIGKRIDIFRHCFSKTKSKKKNMKIKKALYIIFPAIVLLLTTEHVQAVDYEPLEDIPGVTGSNPDFSSYIEGLYNFSIAFVAIAALLMITVGGFYYISSAGNQAQAGSAKKIITDALLGLAVVFCTYLILYTINPDLLNSSPSMDALQSTSTSSTSVASSAQSTAHSSNQVSQSATQPQTYCNGNTCYNSFNECQIAGGGDCTSMQGTFSGTDAKYVRGENGEYTEYENEEACEAAGADCKSASEMKAEMLNNVNSSEEIIEDVESSGGTVSEGAKDDMNNATEKTTENMQAVIENSDGGEINSVDSNGTTYTMEGSTDETRHQTSSVTVEGFQEMAESSPEQVTVVQETSEDGKTVYTKYEFSEDYPDESLAGTVATYEEKTVKTARGSYTKYSDVTVTAAQEIVTCSASGC